MKRMLAILMVVGFSLVVSAQSGQDIRRYAYHLWGTAIEEGTSTMTRLTVCFVPTVRPINGRVPCVKAGTDGTFAMTVKDIPDKYRVCASTTDSPFKFANDTDPTHRVTCSKEMEFGAADDCRKVDLKLEGTGQ